MVKSVSVAILAVVILAGFGRVPASAANGDNVASMRRLTEQEYRNSIADIFGKDIVVQGMFEPASGSAAWSRPAPQFSRSRRSVLIPSPRWPTASPSRSLSEKARARLISCKPTSATAPDDACAAQFFGHYGLMLFRRPLTSDELQSRVKLAAQHDQVRQAIFIRACAMAWPACCSRPISCSAMKWRCRAGPRTTRSIPTAAPPG